MPSVQADQTPQTNGKRDVNTHYHVSATKITKGQRGSLVDRGANGGIVGSDAHVIHQYTKTVDVTGIDNHEMSGLKIVDASATAVTQKGPVVIIMKQYAYHGRNRSIHSSGQIEWFKNRVDDRSLNIGGKQCIKTNDGYVFPLDIINGLPYLKMRPNTQEEWDTLPHVILTSGEEWEPVVLDNSISHTEDWYSKVHEEDDEPEDTPFDELGNYKKRQVITPVKHVTGPTIEDPEESELAVKVHQEKEPELQEEVHLYSISNTKTLRECYRAATNTNWTYVCPDHSANPGEEMDFECWEIEKRDAIEFKRKPVDYDKVRPYFLHVPTEKVRQTYLNTTQFATNIVSGINKYQTHKSPYPAFNVHRRNEPVATDTVFAQTPAIDSPGYNMAQFFVGRKSLVCDIYGMSNTNQFVNTFEDIIRKRGAMDVLISDSARTETSHRVIDIRRALCIKQWTSEAQYQHQNFAEHQYNHIKNYHKFYMNWRDVWPSAWLLNMEWICDVHNHTAQKVLGWRTPIEVLTGQTPDISILTCFLFWDIVYVARHKGGDFQNQLGSIKSDEIRGYFVGFAWNVGHALTFKILTCDTKQVIHRSVVRLADDKHNNLKLDKLAKPEREFIRSNKGEEETLLTIAVEDDAVVIKDKMPPIIETEEIVVPPMNGEQPVGTIKTNQELRAEIEDPSHTMESPKEPQEPTMAYVAPEIGEQYEPKKPPPVLKRRSTRTKNPAERLAPKSMKGQSYYKVETVNENEDDEDQYRSPMDSTPLREESEQPLESLWKDEDERPEQLDPTNKPGRKEHNGVPLDFRTDPLDTPNPTEKGLEPEELLGRSILMPPGKDGSRVRAKIVQQLDNLRDKAHKKKEFIRFRINVNNDYDEIVAYNDIVDYIERDERFDGMWQFERIIDHQGPLRRSDERYKGSTYNVLVEWTDGSTTWEPLHAKDENGKQCGVAATDSVTVAIYAREHGLLDTPGWRSAHIHNIAKNVKKLERRANQAKLHSFRTKPVYMYGFLVPRNYQQAMQFDKENGNDKWAVATKLELDQVDEYGTFEDKGVGFNPGSDWKKIRVHLVFAVKHDGRHKARLVAGGHLTDTPIDSVYSSVVSLRGIRMLTFVAELNNLDVWCTDIGNAYLESYTKEKVYIIGDESFGDRKGHTLIIVKALYGLKSSGKCWHERFATVLREMGFQPSRMEPDIWMRDKGDHYEYIATYVDDCTIVSRDPKAIILELSDTHNFKLKGTGPISFLLGCDYFRDDEGVLCYAPKKYIEKMLDNYKRIFGDSPRKAQTPLDKGDHPELDSSELLDFEDIKIYQSLIGALQWVIQIGRWDVATAVMTMSRFRAAPRRGHLERVKRIHGYLLKYKHGIIRLVTDELDHSQYPEKVYDWSHTCYQGAKEEIPSDAPVPKGKAVVTTTYVDANLLHDLISGRSVTGIVHFLNGTVVDVFSKLQSTVETATFGSEFVAARTAVDQVLALRQMLRYLGVPIKGPSFMFGDNESVVTQSTVPHSQLGRRHNILAYHRTREAIAAGTVRFHHISGTTNPSDIVSKHWDMPSVWETLQPLMFYYREDRVPGVPPADGNLPPANGSQHSKGKPKA